MITLNRCRITPDGKRLVIDAEVENLTYYRDIHIAAVNIDTDETYVPSGPSSHPVYTATYEKERLQADVRDDCNALKTDPECKCGNVYTSRKEGAKRIVLSLSAKDMNLSTLDDNIFIVYVTAAGTPAACTPCGMDDSVVIGVAYNIRPLYDMAMMHIRELADTCSVPMKFTDMILRLHALRLALKTGDYTDAFKLWKGLFKGRLKTATDNGCGCNGNNR